MHAKKTLPTLIQEAIDKGATTVEEIHKSIVDLPLKMLEGQARRCACIGHSGGHCWQQRAPGDPVAIVPTSSARITITAHRRLQKSGAMLRNLRLD